MKPPEEILKPFIFRPFRHTEVVDKDDALLAMNQFADQFRLPDNMFWIPTSERVPKDYQNVLYYDKRDGSIGIGHFIWSQTPVPYVTHFMELPSKPFNPQQL